MNSKQKTLGWGAAAAGNNCRFPIADSGIGDWAGSGIRCSANCHERTQGAQKINERVRSFVFLAFFAAKVFPPPPFDVQRLAEPKSDKGWSMFRSLSMVRIFRVFRGFTPRPRPSIFNPPSSPKIRVHLCLSVVEGPLRYVV